MAPVFGLAFGRSAVGRSAVPSGRSAVAFVFILMLICFPVYDGLAARWVYDRQALLNIRTFMGNYDAPFLCLGGAASYSPPFTPLTKAAGAGQHCRSLGGRRRRKRGCRAGVQVRLRLFWKRGIAGKYRPPFMFSLMPGVTILFHF